MRRGQGGGEAFDSIEFWKDVTQYPAEQKWVSCWLVGDTIGLWAVIYLFSDQVQPQESHIRSLDHY
jgi:hypothetical protein